MSSSSITNFQFKANLILRGKINCLTGLHIGGSKEKLEIGGVDSILVRSPRTDFPYIPGSSIKGKMRHLLEYFTGAVNDPIITKTKDEWSADELHRHNLGNVSKAEKIVRLFGIGANERENDDRLGKLGLSRLVVRDAHPDKKTVDEVWEALGSDAFYTEYKAENTIDRLTSAANPRFIERVVEGSKFDFELVYTVYDFGETDYVAYVNKDIELLLVGLRLLESSALGKSGSRGYGKINFELADPIWVHQKDYQEATKEWEKARQPVLDSDLEPFDQIDLAKFKYQPIPFE
jgi:CRISPR-associated protein Csm3